MWGPHKDRNTEITVRPPSSHWGQFCSGSSLSLQMKVHSQSCILLWVSSTFITSIIPPPLPPPQPPQLKKILSTVPAWRTSDHQSPQRININGDVQLILHKIAEPSSSSSSGPSFLPGKQFLHLYNASNRFLMGYLDLIRFYSQTSLTQNKQTLTLYLRNAEAFLMLFLKVSCNTHRMNLRPFYFTNDFLFLWFYFYLLIILNYLKQRLDSSEYGIICPKPTSSPNQSIYLFICHLFI